MQKTDRIAVIGAGLAGLTAARALVDAGFGVTIFDKGRGLGGRMASRRKDGWRFDHGATVLRPTDDAFAAFMTKTEAKAHAAQWQDGWVGLPGMSGTVKPLAAGLTLHNQAELTALEHGTNGWTLHGAQAASGLEFDRLILAIPQPQAYRLLSPWPQMQAQIAAVEMAPCWTLMAGFDTPLPVELTHARYPDGPIAVIAREGTKPGRDLPGDGWVIQASAEWSRTYLEQERADVQGPLLDAFFAKLGCVPATPTICMAHRWRYALTSIPLGQAYLNDNALGVSVCGDWCLGDTAPHAFTSGRRLAETLIAASP